MYWRSRPVLAVGEDIHQLAQVEVCGIKRDVNIALICEGNPADLLGTSGCWYTSDLP